MPIYTEKQKDYEWLKRHQSPGYVCDTCGGNIRVCWGGAYGIDCYILACFNDVNHTGLRRDFALSPANIPGFNLSDAGKKRRKKLEQKYGSKNIRAVAKYEGVVSLSRSMAGEILEAIWPEAPAAEKARAALLCSTQQLNPLMKHVFLIPFNKDKPNESWATVIGINAKRLMASRRGAFSYIDDTPRIMTEEEQVKRFGSAKKDKLVVIVKLKDPQTGAEAVGYGEWPLKKRAWDNSKKQYVESDNEPYGTDKGNSMFNMATIRGESQALNRLRPGDMPQGIMVMDEAIAEAASKEGIDDANVIEGEARVLDETTGEITETTTDSETSSGASESQKEPVKEETGHESSGQGKEPDLLSLEFKNEGEFRTACLKHFKLSKSQTDKEIPEFDLSNPGQRKLAWQTIVAVYHKA